MLSLDEKTKLLEKLRNKYREGIAQGGAKYFKLDALEKRITFQRENQSDFERFFLDEMKFYQAMQSRATEELEKQKRQQEFHERIHEIMAANDALQEQYADAYFHPIASIEARRMVGAISADFEYIESNLKQLFSGLKVWLDLKIFLADLERFCYKQGNALTAYMSEYIVSIQKNGERYREAADRIFMQTAGVLLVKIVRLLQEQKPALTPVDQDRMQQVSDRVNLIVSNFRLQDLARYAVEKK